jgi:sterol carrier protein 2
MTTQNAYVLGVGLTKFIKPRGEREYPELGYEAGIKAMLDAKINYDDVQTGVACYCYGDSTSGQRIFYQFGMTTIPIYNTNNACATGSAGLHLARTLVRNGAVDCVLVVGFEKMKPGAIRSVWTDRPSPMSLSKKMMDETYGRQDAPPNPQYFGNAGREYMEKYVPSSLLLHVADVKTDTAPKLRISQRSLASAMSIPNAIPTLNSGITTLSNKS